MSCEVHELRYEDPTYTDDSDLCVFGLRCQTMFENASTWYISTLADKGAFGFAGNRRTSGLLERNLPVWISVQATRYDPKPRTACEL
jgi:hypothetical protein